MKDFIATSEIEVQASPGRVWHALTDPLEVKQYMFGSTVETDWKPGSPIVWRGEYEGRTFEDRGEVIECEPGRLLVVSHFSPLAGQPDLPENYRTLHYTLQARDDGTTHVTLSQNHNATASEARHSASNWSKVLAGLKKVVEAT